jgi:hypothetical protein
LLRRQRQREGEKGRKIKGEKREGKRERDREMTQDEGVGMQD